MKLPNEVSEHVDGSQREQRESSGGGDGEDDAVTDGGFASWSPTAGEVLSENQTADEL